LETDLILITYHCKKTSVNGIEKFFFPE